MSCKGASRSSDSDDDGVGSEPRTVCDAGSIGTHTNTREPDVGGEARGVDIRIVMCESESEREWSVRARPAVEFHFGAC